MPVGPPTLKQRPVDFSARGLGRRAPL